MKRPLQSAGSAGFTLIELMIVVAIIGILAVLGVYSVRKYVTNAKSAEARNSLGILVTDEAAAYERESMPGSTLAFTTTAGMSRRLCPSATTTVPASSGSIQGRKYQSAVADWNVDQAANAGFACLKFTIDAPQYFMYSYTLTGAGTAVGDSYVAAAQGDLNGDGVLSLFSITGAIGAGSILHVAPNLVEVRPDE
jgi:type IV pilus assembly protein PilA